MMKKNSVKYIGYDEWNALYEKYEDKDMDSKEIRESLEKDFTELSTKWWNMALSNVKLEDNEYSDDKCVAEVWFDASGEIDFKDMKKVYEIALDRIWYSSDRMNLNRWFYIRWLLNLDKE